MTIIVRGDSHQGSLWFSSDSRGRQCVPNCVIFLSLIKLIPLNSWVKEHLHYVLFCGDEFYKAVVNDRSEEPGFLLLADLTRSFTLGHADKTFTIQENVTYSGTLNKKLFYVNNILMSLEFALNLLFQSLTSVCGGILIFCDCAISLERRNNAYYVFDPHSRCVSGLCAGDGACHVSVYSSLVNLCSYLRDLACSLTNRPLSEVQFDLHTVNMKYA